MKNFLICLSVFSLGLYFGQSLNLRDESLKQSNIKISRPLMGHEIQKYKVLNVIDGDTIKIYYEDKKVSVRVIGINTPEKKNPFRPQECFGEEATIEAKNILKNKKIGIVLDNNLSKFDKFGRLLAYVLIDGKVDFGEQMIKKGYAYEYTYHGMGYEKQKQYKDLQKYAEKNKLGLWAEGICK